MIVYDAERPAAENEPTMAQAIESVATGEMTDRLPRRRPRRRRRAQGRVARPRRRDRGRERRELRRRRGRRRRAAARRRPRAPHAADRRRRAAARARSSSELGARHPEHRDRDPSPAASRTTRCSSRPNDAAIRVLLVEDNEVYRSTLELLLDGRDGIEIVGVVGDGERRRRGGRAPRPRRRPDGLPAARPRRRAGDRAPCARAPRAAIVCLTAEATPEEREAVLAAGAVGFVEKGGPTEELVAAIQSATGRGGGRQREPHAGEHRDRARLDLRLPGRPGAVPEHAGRPALRQLRRGELPRPRRHRLARLLRPPARGARASDDLAADAAGLRRRVRAARAATSGSTRCSSPSKLSGTYQSAVTAAEELGGDRIRVVDTETASLAVRPARARDPAPPRARHDRRGDRGADRAVQGGERRRLHGRDARVPPEGRPHRPRGRRSPGRCST